MACSKIELCTFRIKRHANPNVVYVLISISSRIGCLYSAVFSYYGGVRKMKFYNAKKIFTVKNGSVLKGTVFYLTYFSNATINEAT